MNSDEIKINKIKNILFYMCIVMIILRRYILLVLNEIQGISYISTILFVIIVTGIFIQLILTSTYTYKELILILASTLIFIINRESTMLIMILLSIVSLKIEDKSIVKSYLYTTIILFFISIILNYNISELTINDTIHYRNLNGIPVAREDFGFGNPNIPFLLLLPIYAGYIYLRFDKYNLIDRILLLSTSIFIFIKTQSRTGFITIILALLIIEILKRYKDISKLVYLKYSAITLATISILIGTMFKDSIILNKFLSGRPMFWNVYINNENRYLSLFGNKYDEIIKIANPLDNSYIHIICFLGIIGLILVMVVTYKGISRLIFKKQKKELSIVLMFLIFSFSENILISSSANFSFIILLKQYIQFEEFNFLDNILENKLYKQIKRIIR